MRLAGDTTDIARIELASSTCEHVDVVRAAQLATFVFEPAVGTKCDSHRILLALGHCALLTELQLNFCAGIQRFLR